MSLKFSKLSVASMTLLQWENKMPDHVSLVEEYIPLKAPTRVIRISFKGLEQKGFIHYDGSSAKFLHFCEANHNGSNCSHIAIAAAIGKKLGLHVEKISIKASVDDIEGFANKLKQNKWQELNAKVGLLATIDDEDTDQETSAKPSTPNKTTTKATTAPSRNWKTEWNEIQDYLSEQGCNTRLIINIQNKRMDVFSSVALHHSLTPPAKPRNPYRGPMLARALRHILNGKDLILVGDKGTGKDTLVSTIGWIFGLPLGLQTGNRSQEEESIVGEKEFNEGKTTFETGRFAKAVEYGGIGHYAELNMLDGDVTSIFHPLLDDNKELPTKVGAIKRHPHFIFIGSMNVGASYSGIQDKLNGAFKDRVAVLRLTYTEDFKTLISNASGLTSAHGLTFLENVRKAVKQLIADEDQGHDADTLRGYIDAAKHFEAYGIDLDTKVEAIEDFIINKVEDLDEYMALRQAVRVVFTDLPKTEEEVLYEEGQF